MSGGRLGGVQPCAELLRGRLAALAREIDVDPGALRSYVQGTAVAPAEVKIAVARALGRSLERTWTRQMLATTYRGPRGGGPR